MTWIVLTLLGSGPMFEVGRGIEVRAAIRGSRDLTLVKGSQVCVN